jgi:hypothetical protein
LSCCCDLPGVFCVPSFMGSSFPEIGRRACLPCVSDLTLLFSNPFLHVQTFVGLASNLSPM